ncbi:hypothetical protein [uncultured Sphingomonas sp.]|uniref:hypothetical protein n=1 Tax=uncultured Sphingomonas sp. TaxID=158754 RepID=UPI0035C9B036
MNTPPKPASARPSRSMSPIAHASRMTSTSVVLSASESASSSRLMTIVPLAPAAQLRISPSAWRRLLRACCSPRSPQNRFASSSRLTHFADDAATTPSMAQALRPRGLASTSPTQTPNSPSNWMVAPALPRM